MLVKVCGIKNQEDLDQLIQFKELDMIGFIHVPESPRYVGKAISKPNIDQKVVGVFKNSKLKEIQAAHERMSFDFIQLHGDESREFCDQVKSIAPVIKAFSIKDSSSFEKMKIYEDSCEYFLFDTPSKLGGGSGKQFDWSVLEDYQGSTPFLLSGGIGPNDFETVLNVKHPKLIGIDINSRFETRPGKKDTALIQAFLNELNHEIHS